MDITLLLGIAAVIFIAGVIFIARGLTVEEQNAVPISGPEEIAQLKSSFAPAATDQTRLKLIMADKLRTSHAAPEIVAVGQESGSTSQMERMLTENEDLKKQLAEQKERFSTLERKIEAMKSDYDKVNNSGSQKVHALEHEVLRLQQEKDKLLTARELLDELKSKNEVLKQQYDEHQRQESELRVIISRLESEKIDLLKMQRAGMDRSELDVMNNRLAGSIATIELLKGENKDLKASYNRLEEAFKKCEDLNAQLAEKERRMQYELVKNRAQALGLEKICEDFKIQIESMTA